MKDKTKCPICGNACGFAMGTCVDCGYNYIDGVFRWITIDVGTLMSYVPTEVAAILIDEHMRCKCRSNKEDM